MRELGQGADGFPVFLQSLHGDVPAQRLSLVPPVMQPPQFYLSRGDICGVWVLAPFDPSRTGVVPFEIHSGPF
jgi:hypothetical protein